MSFFHGHKDAAGHDEGNSSPTSKRYRLVEKDDGSQHAENISKREHGVRHGEREIFDNIHPKNSTGTITNATAQPPPIGKLADKEMKRP